MGSSRPVEAARTRSIAYRCTTPVSPALAAGALVALEIIRTDDTLQRRLQSNINRVRATLDSLGLEPHLLPTPIFAFTAGTLSEMEAIEGEMLRRGVIIPLMAYPNGPAPMYFRLAVSARHTPEELDQLAQILHATVPEQQPRGVFR